MDIRKGERVRVHESGDGRKPTVLATVENVGRVLIAVVTDAGEHLHLHDFEVYALDVGDE